MNRSVIVFIAIIAAALLLVATVLTAGQAVPPAIWFVLLLVIVVAGLLFPRITELREYERGVVFRFGKYERILDPGLRFFFPLIESLVRVEMRTQVIDITPQDVMTKDSVRVKIDAIVYTRVVDALKSITTVKDYRLAMTELMRSNIRSAIAKMNLEELLEKTEELNNELFASMKQVSQDWGVLVLRVEIQSVELPNELVQAMTKRKEALEYKAKTETEAAARQISLDILDKAASKMSDRTLAYLYLDALKKISEGKSNKIIFPLELTHLASMIAGKLGDKQAKGEVETVPQYTEIVGALQEAYKEKKKEIIDEATANVRAEIKREEAARETKATLEALKKKEIEAGAQEKKDNDRGVQ